MPVVMLAVILLVLASALMAAAWSIAERTRQSGWADVVWSFSVGGLGIVAALAPTMLLQGWPHRQMVVAILAAVWSLRLGGHIWSRTKGGGDDPRYAELREEWGASAPRRLFWFLQVQAAVAFILACCIGLAARNPLPGLRLLDALGVLLIIVAIVGEAIADRQMQSFRTDPANKGRICDCGLWSLSRHPNYFFEWLGWLAYAVIAIDPTGRYGWGWLAVIGPILMYALLVYVSGIPPLERHMLRSRGAAFRDYQQRVSAFWPWPSRIGQTR